MATKQGPIENLPIAKYSIGDHKPSKKYKEEKDPLTSMLNPEIGPFDIKISEFINKLSLLSNNSIFL